MNKIKERWWRIFSIWACPNQTNSVSQSALSALNTLKVTISVVTCKIWGWATYWTVISFLHPQQTLAQEVILLHQDIPQLLSVQILAAAHVKSLSYWEVADEHLKQRSRQNASIDSSTYLVHNPTEAGPDRHCTFTLVFHWSLVVESNSPVAHTPPQDSTKKKKTHKTLKNTRQTRLY